MKNGAEKRNKKKEKVCETFKIEKGGKEEVKEVCGTKETEISGRGQAEKENKQLKNILIGIGIVAILFVIIAVGGSLMSNFKYEGVKFKIVKDEGGRIFYNTAFAIYSADGAHTADYNFYLRNDPRKLKNISWNGSYTLMEDMVINLTDEFNCDGDGIIALANFIKVHEFFGVSIMKDENASCDSKGNYNFIQIEEGNETKIEEYGPACYKIYINNCEILKGTERFIVETLVAANEKINN